MGIRDFSDPPTDPFIHFIGSMQSQILPTLTALLSNVHLYHSKQLNSADLDQGYIFCIPKHGCIFLHIARKKPFRGNKSFQRIKVHQFW